MRKGSYSLASVVVTVIALRIVVLLILHMWSVNAGNEGFAPIVMGGDDGPYYYNIAVRIVDGSQPAGITNYYPVAIAQLMLITGIRDILFFKVLNCLAGCATVILAMKLFRLVERYSPEVMSGTSRGKYLSILVILVGLYPSAVVNCSISLYRDAWIYLLHMLSVYYSLRMVLVKSKHQKVVFGALFAAAFAVLFILRWYAALATLFGLFVWFARGFVSGRKSGTQVVSAGIVLLMSAIGLFWVMQSLDLVPGSDRFEQLAAFRGASQVQVESGSNSGIDMASAPIYLFPVLYIYSLVSNAIGPLIWQVRNLQMLLTVLLECPLLTIAAYGIWAKRRFLSKPCLFLLGNAFVYLALISLMNDNLGTATRLRVPVWDCIFVVFAYVLYAVRADMNRSNMAES